MKNRAILLFYPAAALFSIALSGALPAGVATVPSLTTATASAVSSRSTDFITASTPTASPIDLVTPMTNNFAASNDTAPSRVAHTASSTSTILVYTPEWDSDNDNGAVGGVVPKNEYVAYLIFMAVGVPLGMFCLLWFLSHFFKCLRDRGWRD